MQIQSFEWDTSRREQKTAPHPPTSPTKKEGETNDMATHEYTDPLAENQRKYGQKYYSPLMYLQEKG